MIPKDSSVKLDTLRPEMLRLAPIIDRVYEGFGVPAVVTSTHDGLHMKGSLHYRDAAFDLRVKSLRTSGQQQSLYRTLRAAISREYPGLYDIVLEKLGSPNAHIHVEFGPELVAEVLEGKGANA